MGRHDSAATASYQARSAARPQRLARPARRGSSRRGVLVAGLLLVSWLAADAARAQPRRAPVRPPSRPGVVGVLSASVAASDESLRFAEPPPEEPPPSRGLRSRVGLERAKELVASADLGERLRGIERLRRVEADEAVEVLVDGLAPGSALRENPQTRLMAVRALAAHGAKPAAHSALLSVLGVGSASAADLPLTALAAETAAMALARSGRRKALTALLAAVVAGGSSGRMAERALLAHPPSSLASLFGASDEPLPVRLIDLLGRLGDQRAVALLRRQLDSERPQVRLRAAIALARLGDGSVESLGRRLARSSGRRGAAGLAGVEILALLGVPGTDEALGRLLAQQSTRAAALGAAARAPSPLLVPALTAVATEGRRRAERLRALGIMARIGDEASAKVLGAALERAESATVAAVGLAKMPGSSARAVLERALRGTPRGAARRLVLRSGVVRYLELGEVVDGLPAALDGAFRSGEPADRATASFGLTALGLRSAPELLADEDPVVATAAARASLVLGDGDGAPCRQVLQQADRARVAVAPAERDLPAELSPAVVACGYLLLRSDAGVSAATLADWADAGGALAPAAALALARIDSELYRSRLRALLDGTDPVVRAHVAYGLARSPRADAASLLTSAYRFEPDRAVRLAVVRALAVRREPLRRATLELARELDPDEEVRAAARAAARRSVLLPAPRVADAAMLWLALQASEGSEPAAVGQRPVRVVRDDGLAVPVVTAPDGVLLVPGVPSSGGAAVQLAP